MSCEICGKRLVNRNVILIGKAKLIVCDDCKRFGKPASFVDNKQAKPKPVSNFIKPKKVITTNIPEVNVREDYAEVIRKARENLGITQDILASSVGEKLSIIKKIEAGKMKPTIDLAKKLERFLKINLIEIESNVEYAEKKASKSDITVADVLDIKDGD